MKSKTISMDHGSGGEASRELIEDIFLPRLDNRILRTADDSAVIKLDGSTFAMTTDSYVVSPIDFPGGNIGSLAVHGTVNDLSMQGAKPLYLTLGLILEEGLPLSILEKIADEISKAAKESMVEIIAGDTKVVPKGYADQIYINTAGIGIIPKHVDVSASNALPGDKVLINGTIGDHGMAIMSSREGLELKTPILSDSSPLNNLVSSIFDNKVEIHVLRDPTRGGVATALNEIASQSKASITLFEKDLPINPPVLSSCEILGLDPLYVANEGKFIVIVPDHASEQTLSIMKKHPYGKNARIIGEVTDGKKGRVLLKTQIGGTRILSMLSGEQLPRIC